MIYLFSISYGHSNSITFIIEVYREDNKKSSGENVFIAIGIENAQQSAMIATFG